MYKKIFTTKTIILLITTLGIFTFFSALFNGFVWDDNLFILNNPNIHNVNLLYLFGKNIFNIGSYYRPIPALYFASLYSLFGTNAFPYHFVQISLHICNTILLYFVLHKLFNDIVTKDFVKKESEWSNLSGSQKVKYSRKHGSFFKQSIDIGQESNILALFLSLFFLVHPIQVESVSYIAGGTPSVLFFLFGIIALLISMKDSLRGIQLFYVSIFLLLSLLTKESGISFLFITLLYQFIFIKKNFTRVLLTSVITLTIYFIIRFAIGGVFFEKPVTSDPVPIVNLPFMQRLIHIPAIILYYLKTILLPLRLTIMQNWIITKITFTNFYLPLIIETLVLTLIASGAIYLHVHKRTYLALYIFFSLWLISGLMFFLQIFPLDMTVADRWMYFSVAGVVGFLGIGLKTFLMKYKKMQMAIILIGIIIIPLFSFRTIKRNQNFYDNVSLYSHDAQLQPNALMEIALEDEYVRMGQQRAMKELQVSAKQKPYPTNLFELGNLYESQGNLQKAAELYLQAVNSADTYYSIGQIHNANDERIYIRLVGLLLLSKQNEAAAAISQKGLKYFPTSGSLWYELAISENQLHHQKEALFAVSKAQAFSQTEEVKFLYSAIKNKQNIPLLLVSALLQQQTPILLLTQ